MLNRLCVPTAQAETASFYWLPTTRWNGVAIRRQECRKANWLSKSVVPASSSVWASGLYYDINYLRLEANEREGSIKRSPEKPMRYATATHGWLCIYRFYQCMSFSLIKAGLRSHLFFFSLKLVGKNDCWLAIDTIIDWCFQIWTTWFSG